MTYFFSLLVVKSTSAERKIMSFNIIGTGSYLPPQIVTNDDLAKTLDTSDEWITQRVGISTRHISVDECAADMGYQAALKALEMAKTQPDEIDLIIAASITGDNICPTVAGTIQKMLGSNAISFDINSACSGFLFALDTAAGFFERGTVKKALVIGSERMSKILDWNDRSTCVIFGDGAGAVVLEVGDGYIASKLSTKGDDDVIKIPTGRNNSPFYKKTMDEGIVFMDGQETFKFAVNTITREISDIANENNISLNDIKYIVPHQANIRIIQYASKRLNIPMEKFSVNIERCGNTSAASIPIALDELCRAKDLQKGSLIVFSAFGGGLSTATTLIKW
ncbi:MAG: ketoacyl-ACP synthase III [Eubacteriales bacterium]|nr:ketoacyl-ACP synthase III [Eubacteriales bacterium]